MMKKIISILLTISICLLLCVSVLANQVNTDNELANKLGISIDKMKNLSPKLVEQLHKDFDNVNVLSTNKSHFIIEKSKDTNKSKIINISETEFRNLTKNKIDYYVSDDKYFVGVGTLTSYILSDNSIAMSMELLDSYKTGVSGSFEVLMSIEHIKGDNVGGTTLYSRNRPDGSYIEQGSIEHGFDYVATIYTVPEMVTETDRYLYLSTDCEGDTQNQVINTDFAVCTYNLNITLWPEKISELFDNFFIESKTYHYSDGCRS
ncbi:hypothetical protein B5E58_13220 [Tyzzerella sp. An114]|uniref:hypothetical protein n=1 Tax=Tyzzerella sp. An114 TaxID=1965545 RepID=UPI000B444F32|nr:hypothetical protein [Tyzzerella sp. An114]OUQ53641.1 hypothetical protein B5E58_13220 [Tyzzerella sp. An114]